MKNILLKIYGKLGMVAHGYTQEAEAGGLLQVLGRAVLWSELKAILNYIERRDLISKNKRFVDFFCLKWHIFLDF